MRSNRVYRILSFALQSNQNLDMHIQKRHLQPGGGRRSGVLSAAELRTGSKNRHLSVSRVQHRTQTLNIHQGVITNTMKTLTIVLGLASFLSLFTVGQAKSIKAGE
jgi:hypothetical protein